MLAVREDELEVLRPEVGDADGLEFTFVFERLELFPGRKELALRWHKGCTAEQDQWRFPRRARRDARLWMRNRSGMVPSRLAVSATAARMSATLTGSLSVAPPSCETTKRRNEHHARGGSRARGRGARLDVTQSASRERETAATISPVSFSLPYPCAVSICRRPASTAILPSSTGFFFALPVPLLTTNRGTSAHSILLGLGRDGPPGEPGDLATVKELECRCLGHRVLNLGLFTLGQNEDGRGE